MRGLSAILMILPLAACGTPGEPTSADLRATWEARNVAPTDYKSDILAVMRTYLNDPTGVRNAGVTPPHRKILPDEPGERLVSCLRYTAKKSTGQYAPPSTAIVAYLNGKLDRVIDTPTVVRDICKDAAYEPFPELQQLTRQ